MLNVYASTFMIATRTNGVRMRDARPEPKKRRWLPAGHWWLQKTRYVDLGKL